MTYQFAEIDGTKIHYEIRGEGTAVVLIHAGIFNLNMWDAQMESFTKRHRVLRYDLRGWGETVRTDDSFSFYGDLHALLKFVGIEKVSLVGLSLGARVAVDFVLAYPNMVEKLVLIGPAVDGYEWTYEAIKDKVKMIDEAYDQGEIAEAAEIETQLWFDGIGRTPVQVDQTARKQAFDMVFHTFSLPEGQGKHIDMDPSAINRLAEIRTPTLVVVGAEDVPDIHAVAKILHQQISQVRKKTVSDTAHFPNMEKPVEFNQLVLSFLEN